MSTIDLLISNDRHHTAMMAPLAERIGARRGDRVRVLSLCELRGMTSPAEVFRRPGVELHRVLARSPRRTPALGRQSRIPGARTARRLARELAWRWLLAPRFRGLLGERPDLAVLPNDAAYPYDRIAATLGRAAIPFVLLQEGLRFPLPAAAADRYGGGGAAAIAAWGEASAEFFRRQGAPPERIRLTGSPRFDGLSATDWRDRARDVVARYALAETNLLLVSNPIDDQGYCTTAEKMRLVRRFAQGLGALLAEPDFRLVVKLHARESESGFREALGDLPGAARIVVLVDAPLYPLLAAARAVVVLTSTVALEALLLDRPVGVLEIPGAGFPLDLVAGGAARGLRWSAAMTGQVRDLLDCAGRRSRDAEDYLRHNLVARGGATERVVALIDELVAAPSASGA